MTGILGADDIAARIAAAQNPPPPTEPARPTAPPRRRRIRPLSEAADALVAQAKTAVSGERIHTGIHAFDVAMRGIAPKELLVIQGFAHGGKTLVSTEIIRNNTDRRILLVTADEDRVLVLAKLVSLVSGVPAEELEDRIANGDPRAERLVREIATDTFPNLVVVDDVSDLRGMTAVADEAAELWGSPAELVIFDYLDLLEAGEGGGDTRTKFSAIKAWGKQQSVPLVVMHQASRTGGADGQEITMTSGAYGGEQQATFIIGVRRQKNYWAGQIRDLEERQRTQMRPSEGLADRIQEAKWQYEYHRNTITLNLVKNKRPPGRLVEDIDYVLDGGTGRITPVGHTEPPPATEDWPEAELWEGFDNIGGDNDADPGF